MAAALRLPIWLSLPPLPPRATPRLNTMPRPVGAHTRRRDRTQRTCNAAVHKPDLSARSDGAHDAASRTTTGSRTTAPPHTARQNTSTPLDSELLRAPHSTCSYTTATAPQCGLMSSHGWSSPAVYMHGDGPSLAVCMHGTICDPQHRGALARKPLPHPATPQVAALGCRVHPLVPRPTPRPCEESDALSAVLASTSEPTCL